jgi:hypothetical protein
LGGELVRVLPQLEVPSHLQDRVAPTVTRAVVADLVRNPFDSIEIVPETAVSLRYQLIAETLSGCMWMDASGEVTGRDTKFLTISLSMAAVRAFSLTSTKSRTASGFGREPVCAIPPPIA